MNTLREAFEDLRDILAFAPDVAVALIILLIAGLLALGTHALAVALADRLLSGRSAYLRTFLLRTRGLTRVAILLLFIGLALPAAPLSANTAWMIGKLAIVTFIALVGWTAITILHIASDIHLRRFRLDVADNLLARKHVTQIRILLRTIDTILVLVTIAAALMSFESVRQYGLSLFASAGVAGLVAGLAARPVLSNLFAGIQLAMTQPIRIDDIVVVQKEWGRVEEITSTYVVLRLWDLRRLIVPLTYFLEQPFENWTREQGGVLGSVLFYLDYAAPIDAIRAMAQDIAEASPYWDRKVLKVHVTDARESGIEVRVLIGITLAGAAGDVRNEMREKIIGFLQREHPEALPRQRQINLTPAIPQEPDDAKGRPGATGSRLA